MDYECRYEKPIESGFYWCIIYAIKHVFVNSALFFTQHFNKMNIELISNLLKNKNIPWATNIFNKILKLFQFILCVFPDEVIFFYCFSMMLLCFFFIFRESTYKYRKKYIKSIKYSIYFWNRMTHYIRYNAFVVSCVNLFHIQVLKTLIIYIGWLGLMIIVVVNQKVE